MKVEKWGDYLAVRLPASDIKALGLREGADVEICADKSRTFTMSAKNTVDERLDRLRKYRGRLPADFKFDRESLNAREDVE